MHDDVNRLVIRLAAVHLCNTEIDRDYSAADITEIVITGLNPEASKLVVEWWTPAHGLRRIERE